MTHLTQFRKWTKFSKPCDVIIGLDFGTSCTKVVVRTPYHNNSMSFAVPFNELSHSSSEYLLPSVLCVQARGQVTLSQGDHAECIRDIKSSLMRSKPVPISGTDGQRTIDSTHAAVAYLALVIRLARGWFLEEQSTLYSTFDLDWQVNIGLPSSDYAERALCETYIRVTRAAWYLSIRKKPVTLEGARDVLRIVDELGDESDQYIIVKAIPEVAAEVVGYAKKSDLRGEGLHILIDVGASTLDVCGFVLHEKEGEDRYELLTADVRRLGALNLFEHRIRSIRSEVNLHLTRLWERSDPAGPLPDDLSGSLPNTDSLSDTMNELDADYAAKCKRAIFQTIVDLKMRRDPRSPRWKSELPVFLAGGASVMPFYKEVISHVDETLCEFYPQCSGIRQITMTKPEGLNARIGADTYYRFAVAWGLSYPDTDIGTVCRPDEIEDIASPTVRRWRDRFISKDHV